MKSRHLPLLKGSTGLTGSTGKPEEVTCPLKEFMICKSYGG
jgi:hypothetical protein